MEQKTEHIDPVCGMKVQESPTAVTTEYKGKIYYFCMPAHKEAFEKEPEKYLRKGPQMEMKR